MTRAWILNLDADDELASRAPRDPFAALERRPALREALAALVGDDPVLGRADRAPAGAEGRAFAPTPSVLAALARAGAVVPPAPSVEVLRRVADRRFALPWPGGVPGAAVITSLEAAAVHLARLGAAGGARVMKRVHGFAGRGRLVRRGPALDAAAGAFLERALREHGAVVLEPWLDRTLDVALHGFVHRTGAVVLGAPTVQETTAAGTWVASRRAAAGELAAGEERALVGFARDGAAALAAAGFFGPFGVDAMRVAVGGGEALVRCEVNPRYTMGWAIGMGDERPDRVAGS